MRQSKRNTHVVMLYLYVATQSISQNRCLFSTHTRYTHIHKSYTRIHRRRNWIKKIRFRHAFNWNSICDFRSRSERRRTFSFWNCCMATTFGWYLMTLAILSVSVRLHVLYRNICKMGACVDPFRMFWMNEIHCFNPKLVQIHHINFIYFPYIFWHFEYKNCLTLKIDQTTPKQEKVTGWKTNKNFSVGKNKWPKPVLCTVCHIR